MRALLVAIGNPLRGDDGVAACCLAALPAALAERREVQGLLPELAAELPAYDVVVFIDAAVGIERWSLARVSEDPEAAPPLSHALAPGGLVALARGLFGFAGEAWVCAIPGRSFEAGTPPSPAARRHSEEAAGAVAALLRERSADEPI